MQSGFPGLQLGNMNVPYFSLIVLAGLLEMLAASALVARKNSERVETAVDAIFSALILSVVFGRMAYILFPPPSTAIYYSRDWYFAHWSDLLVGPFAFWSGGLDPAGLWLGALIGAGISLWRGRANLWLWADILTPGGLIFLAIAPWANVVNQQMFGPPTELPWGMSINNRVAPLDNLTQFPVNTRFHPTPAYVAIGAVLALSIYLAITFSDSRVANRAGARYLISAAVMLALVFLADFLRVDISRPVFDLSALQSLAVLLIAGIIPLLVGRLKNSAGIQLS